MSKGTRFENEYFDTTPAIPQICPPKPPEKEEEPPEPDTDQNDDNEDDFLPRMGRYTQGLDPNNDEELNPPCYLPQLKNEPTQANAKDPLNLGSDITGRIDWSPMAPVTGSRPVVDRYSIARYSPNEWRTRNNETVKKVQKIYELDSKNIYSSRTALMRIGSLVKKSQNETNHLLRLRTKLVGKWKKTLEAAMEQMAEEIATMEEERIRLKKSVLMLGIPDSIATECLDKRSGRPGTELVRDTVEDEIRRELVLIADLRQLFEKTLKDFQVQQKENRIARERLEFDWSDKKESFEFDILNLSLTCSSNILLFKPGCVRQPAEQTSEEQWAVFSADTVEECESCRQRSVMLRLSLNDILYNAAKDLRTQADIVEKAFTSRINCTQENLTRFENDLKEVLKRLGAAETRIERLQAHLRSFDGCMKLAQTRMDNRNHRINIEYCRDEAQAGLIDEIDTIQSGVTAMLADLQDAENIKVELMDTRKRLESEIMLKRRAKKIDQEDCMLLRAHFPSINTLSGIAS